MYRVEILAVVIAAVIIVLVLILNFYPVEMIDQQIRDSQDTEHGQEYTAEDDCATILSPEHCDDIALKDRAFMESNPELCDLIKDQEIKDHCKRYFR